MSSFQLYPFYSAYTHLNDIHGIDMDRDTFEVAGMTAWRHIGNKHTRMYRAKLPVHVDMEYGYVAQIPCNCFEIESITIDTEDAKNTSSVVNYPGYINQSFELYNESMKSEVNDLYQSGKLVKYRQVGENLYFSEPYSSVNILYKGIYADEDGLPYINFKELEAIAAYCVYIYFHKKALSTMDANAASLAQATIADWQNKCSAARAPEYVTQNEMNTILDAVSSWNRKAYGRTYKPINK